jgi:hypothetical protein
MLILAQAPGFIGRLMTTGRVHERDHRLLQYQLSQRIEGVKRVRVAILAREMAREADRKIVFHAGVIGVVLTKDYPLQM